MQSVVDQNVGMWHMTVLTTDKTGTGNSSETYTGNSNETEIWNNGKTEIWNMVTQKYEPVMK